MLTILAEAALRAFVLGGAVWLGLHLFRVRNPNAHMTAWTLVLLASLAMPLLMHWTTVTITVQAPPAAAGGELCQPKKPCCRRCSARRCRLRRMSTHRSRAGHHGTPSIG